jgi:hypothetical protein
VYIDTDEDEDSRLPGEIRDIFQQRKMHLTTYAEFLTQMSKNAYGVAMKETDARTFTKLRDDLENPAFYQDISEF